MGVHESILKLSLHVLTDSPTEITMTSDLMTMIRNCFSEVDLNLTNVQQTSVNVFKLPYSKYQWYSNTKLSWPMYNNILLLYGCGSERSEYAIPAIWLVHKQSDILLRNIGPIFHWHRLHLRSISIVIINGEWYPHIHFRRFLYWPQHYTFYLPAPSVSL